MAREVVSTGRYTRLERDADGNYFQIQTHVRNSMGRRVRRPKETAAYPIPRDVVPEILEMHERLKGRKEPMKKICPVMSGPVSDGTNVGNYIVHCEGSRCAFWVGEPGREDTGSCGLTPRYPPTFRDPAIPPPPPEPCDGA